MPVFEIKRELRKYASKKKAKILQRFFKTGPGEYAQGDIFLGVKVPDARKVALCYRDLDLKEALSLLRSPIHEERLLALLILVSQYRRGGNAKKEKIFKLYLANSRYINNWDLVDLTAHHILGNHLKDKDRGLLYSLARSKALWQRRTAVIATFHFIRNGQFEDTFAIARMLISDKEDLIHKAVGWMLREAGKRDMAAEENFLKRYYRQMPRTMLRYAIERFPQHKRLAYLEGKV